MADDASTSDDYDEEEDTFGDGPMSDLTSKKHLVTNRSFRDSLSAPGAGPPARRSLYTHKTIRNSLIALTPPGTPGSPKKGKKRVSVTPQRKSVLAAIQKEQGRFSVYGQTQAFFEARDIEKRGWLRKRGHLKKNWKERWFILEDGIIEYWDAEGGDGRKKGQLELIGTPMVVDLEHDVFEPPKNKGEEKIPVENCFFVEVGGDVPHRKLQHLVMSAPDEDTMWDWIYAVKATWVDPDGVTSLMTVAEQGDVEELTDILKAGADVNLQSNTGTTAAMHAIMAGDVACLELLTKHGADLEMQTLTGNTAIMNAVREEEYACLEFLLSRRADPSIVNDDGDTAISLVVQARDDPDPDRDPALKTRMDYLDRLIEAKATLDTKNNKGMTPLMTASQRGDESSVIALIAAGADLDCAEETHTGHNACMLAAAAKQNAILRRLLDAGASTHHRDNRHRSLLEVAQAAGNTEALDFLKGVGLTEFNEHPQDLNFDEGSTFSLTAVASGNPAPDVEWRLDGKSVHPSGDVQIVTKGLVTDHSTSGTMLKDGGGSVRSTLTVRRAGFPQSGKYVAYGKNAAGTVRSRPCDARMTVPPRFTNNGQPHSVTVDPGDSVVFSVQVDSGTRPIPTFQWYQVAYKPGEDPYDRYDDDDNSDDEGDGDGDGGGDNGGSGGDSKGRSKKKKGEKGEEVEGATEAALEMDAVAVEDAAKFYCRVVNSAGSIRSRTANLRVNCPPFLQPQEGASAAVQVVAGRVRIAVDIKATPEPALQWYSREDEHDKDEYKLRKKTEPTIEVNPQKKGIYNIEAENSAGKLVVQTFKFPAEGGLINALKKYAPS